MEKLKQLLELRRADLKTLHQKTVDEDRNFDEAEQTRYDELKAEIESLKSRIAREEEIASEERAFVEAQRAPGNSLDGGDAEGEGSQGRVAVGADREAEKPFEHIGEQLFAIRSVGGPEGPDKRLLYQARANGMSSGVPADGGFLLQNDFTTNILQRIHAEDTVAGRAQAIPVGPNANGVTIPAIDETSRADGSRSGGVRGYWVGEATAPTKSKPKFTQIELKLKKVSALWYATDEQLEDSTSLGAVAEILMARELEFKVGDAFINGDGAGKPLGILNAGCLVSAAKESGQSATTVVYENIVNMWARLWARSRANAVWFINQDIEPQLFTMNLSVGTGGIPVYLPAGGASASPFGNLLGRPVIPIEYAATLGTVGDIILADMSQYVKIDKGGIKGASSIHVKFIEGEQTFRLTYRIDGQAWWSSALTPYKGSNTQSPFVALATRS